MKNIKPGYILCKKNICPVCRGSKENGSFAGQCYKCEGKGFIISEVKYENSNVG